MKYKMSILDLGPVIFNSVEEQIELFQQHSLLATRHKCPACHVDMEMQLRSDIQDKYRRIKLLGVVLYYTIYRSRDPNLCRVKDNANQWKVTVLEVIFHTILLYQAVIVRNKNILAVF